MKVFFDILYINFSPLSLFFYPFFVATTSEVTVLALSWTEESNKIKLIPTVYKTPIENLIIVKVIGSQCGRIFMVGSDGNLYELDYKSTESPWGSLFYNFNQREDQEILSQNHIHKCRKINHTSCDWKILSFLPPFLRNNNVEMRDPLIDVCVDNVRNVLYTTSMGGVIDIYYLGLPSTSTSSSGTAPVALSVTKDFNVLQEVKKFLSKNPIVPQNSSENSFEDPRASAIIGLFSIPITESRNVHTLILLGNGSRIYLSLLGSDKNPFNAFFLTEKVQPPVGIEIAYIRYPPSVAVIKYVTMYLNFK